MEGPLGPLCSKAISLNIPLKQLCQGLKPKRHAILSTTSMVGPMVEFSIMEQKVPGAIMGNTEVMYSQQVWIEGCTTCQMIWKCGV